MKSSIISYVVVNSAQLEDIRSFPFIHQRNNEIIINGDLFAKSIHNYHIAIFFKEISDSVFSFCPLSRKFLQVFSICGIGCYFCTINQRNKVFSCKCLVCLVFFKRLLEFDTALLLTFKRFCIYSLPFLYLHFFLFFHRRKKTRSYFVYPVFSQTTRSGCNLSVSG
jgi:hypothetical protein